MSKRHADSTPDEKAPKRRKTTAHKVLVEAARNGDTTAVRVGLEKLSPDTDSKKVSFDAVHEACRGNHDECLALLLPYVETTQMGFGMLLSECIHADHTACTEVLLQHWKSFCSNVAFVPHGKGGKKDRPCPAMWADPAVCQVLIDAGADIETKDKDSWWTPLISCSAKGELSAVKMLVQEGARLRSRDRAGHTCLTLAAYFGHTETVRYLVGLPEVGVNHRADDGNTAVLSAARKNRADTMTVLIDAGADIEAKNSDGRSPLLAASKLGNLDVVKVLARAGADVCVIDNYKATCLMLASVYKHPETVRYLVGLKGVDVNHSGQHGYTVLHWVGRYNCPEAVKVLLEGGADIEAKNDKGHSPLLNASMSGALDVVKVLVRAGAGVCVTDNRGAICLSLAAHHGHTETVRTLLCMPEVDLKHVDNTGATALSRAVLGKRADVVEVLIDAGADIDVTNENGRSPLLLASMSGHLDIVKMLVEAGAGVCVTDNKGDTCLIVAAVFGHIETVRYLTSLPEVDVNHANQRGYTALQIAKRKGHKGVVKFLCEHTSL